MATTEQQKLRHTLYMRGYRKKASYRAMQVRVIADWRRNNPEKRSAHRAVYKAIVAGKITRPELCDICKVACKPQGHHKDYSKKLEVDWLCGNCHRDIHKNNTEKGK